GVYRLGECRDRHVVLSILVEADAAVERTDRGDARARCDRHRQNGQHAHCPAHRVASRSRLRSISSAIWLDCHFTDARSPVNRNRRDVTAPTTARPMKTVPTGLVGVPPPGPAIPVTDSPHGLPDASQIPRAIASAHGPLTAP